MSQTIADKPNVLFVITDDQGYGDLGCHGNTIINTPHLDKLHSQSVRFTNFHVGPTCAPTRAGIMTGRYCNSTGVWHTVGGRSLLRESEITMGDIFRENGYRTGMFGKWHLGDNYPFRPHDRGFEKALYHGGGGISQTPDYWKNDYFDDTYFRNGITESFKGYCTDVWFDEALKFIEDKSDRPFLCYLSTNAPHSPFRVPPIYSNQYHQQVPDFRSRFYGMITNIDENISRLRTKLRDLGIEENTILIFMTDNGTAAGCSMDNHNYVVNGFNAGMRGKKGSEYDGGHRVPLFIHWPKGKLVKGRDIEQLSANIDLLPTLIELCGLTQVEDSKFHGISLAPFIREENKPSLDRVVVTDSQRVEQPIKWKQSATMTQQWRLINGKELYDMKLDPEQRYDVALQNQDIVHNLRQHYEEWWEIVSTRFDEECPIIIGNAQEKCTTLTSHDWHGERQAWNQGQIRNGLECNGYWSINVEKDGEYIFELRRWPKEEDRPIRAGIPGETIDLYHGGKELMITTASIIVGDRERIEKVSPVANSVEFRLFVQSGPTRLKTYFNTEEGTQLGAYYVYVTQAEDIDLLH
tara:strand:- start:12621 stop:14357 length:1737 start_codon:yes stop_codon:yes gene_type:complete